MTLDKPRQIIHQNPPQPGQKLGLGFAAELLEIAVGL
jgi:hypothetical protein